MRVLGIDPGIGTIGFGLLELTTNHDDCTAIDWGVISTTKNTPHSQRLNELFQDMVTLLEHTQPDMVVIEKIFYFRNVTTMVPVCEARGVIQLTIEQAGLPIHEYTPMQVKQAITGYGKAKKRELQDTIAILLNLEKAPSPDDAADGLAMAYCHYTSTLRGQHLIRTKL